MVFNQPAIAYCGTVFATSIAVVIFILKAIGFG
jgi:hypothetical protein